MRLIQVFWRFDFKILLLGGKRSREKSKTHFKTKPFHAFSVIGVYFFILKINSFRGQFFSALNWIILYFCNLHEIDPLGKADYAIHKRAWKVWSAGYFRHARDRSNCARLFNNDSKTNGLFNYQREMWEAWVWGIREFKIEIFLHSFLLEHKYIFKKKNRALFVSHSLQHEPTIILLTSLFRLLPVWGLHRK